MNTNALEREDELNQWEVQLSEAEEQLEYLTSPDFDAQNEADADYREKDIEFTQALIIEASKNIAKLKSKIPRQEATNN